ncbi:MAG: S8 family serine peptidase [Gemmataceae bacterium]|nr:S8 family serine peptidase [Gemmataceae bacterium]
MLVSIVPYAPAGGVSRLLQSLSHRPHPSAEEATPDCGPILPSVDPQRERVRHLAALGVDRWHQAGITGKGVKVAVLDSGFRGYREFLGKALPGKVTARSFRNDGNMEAKDSQHGILCSEVLHALAPDAELILATWEPDNVDQFLNAARWARQQGARIITCSIIMPSWSDGDGGGPVHDALTKILGAGNQPGDVLCFASAGNTAKRHWFGTFHDGGDGIHEWQAGTKDNLLKPWGSERVSVELYWQPGGKYQLHVMDATTGAEVGRSKGVCGPNRCCAVVRFQPTTGHRYRVRVEMSQGPAKPFHLVALGGELKCTTAAGSIAFPADGPEVVAVGAVDLLGHRATYSSCGPNSKCPKPDLVAPVPFPTFHRDRPFSGTSAAAPQAAALAALCWSRHPEWNAVQVREALRRSARDLGPPGHDYETGHGMIGLQAAE